MADCCVRIISLNFTLVELHAMALHASKATVCSGFVPCVSAREHCWISPPHFLAECRKRQLNQGFFVASCIVCFFWVVFSLQCIIICICILSCIFQREPMWMAPYCADVPLRIYSLIHSAFVSTQCFANVGCHLSIDPVWPDVTKSAKISWRAMKSTRDSYS